MSPGLRVQIGRTGRKGRGGWFRICGEWVSRSLSRNRGHKQTQGYRQGLESRGSSAAIDGDVVPEDGIGGGSHLLSLAGREGGQESLEFVGQEAGRGWRARRVLPQIQMLEDLADHGPVFDEGNNSRGVQIQ